MGEGNGRRKKEGRSERKEEKEKGFGDERVKNVRRKGEKGRGVGEGKAKKVGWGEERGVLEKEMKGKIGRREREEENTLRVKWENGRRGRKVQGGRQNGRKKGIERVVVSWSAVNR